MRGTLWTRGSHFTDTLQLLESRGVSWRTDVPLDVENAGPPRMGSFCALSVEMVREVSWSLLERLEVSLVEGRVIGPPEV